MYTRREFGRLTLAGLAAPAFGGLLDSNTGGVRLGVQTYSFRDLPRSADAVDMVDVVIRAMTECGLTECELFAPQVEPRLGPPGGRGTAVTPGVQQARQKARQDLRAWRLETPIDHFRAIKQKFAA